MNGRELYPDEQQRQRIMDFIMAAGQTLLENGAEVFRVQQTMEIMARSFHLREFHVYVLTNGIFASAGTAEISEVRNVPTRTTHLGRVAAVNQLSRQIAAGGITIDEAESRLVQAKGIPFPKDRVQLAAGPHLHPQLPSAPHRGQPRHHRHPDDPDPRHRLYHGHPGLRAGRLSLRHHSDDRRPPHRGQYRHRHRPCAGGLFYADGVVLA